MSYLFWIKKLALMISINTRKFRPIIFCKVDLFVVRYFMRSDRRHFRRLTEF